MSSLQVVAKRAGPAAAGALVVAAAGSSRAEAQAALSREQLDEAAGLIQRELPKGEGEESILEAAGKAMHPHSPPSRSEPEAKLGLGLGLGLESGP